MNDETNKINLSLEQVLVSYKIMITFFLLFIILVVVLMITNKNGFNKLFGYEIFITIPFVLLITFFIKEIFEFKNNPSNSIFSKFSLSNNKMFMPIVFLSILSIGILGVFMVLYVGGVLSDNPPENNTSMILNLLIIMLFIITAFFIYNSYKNKDNNILKKLPRTMQYAFQLRTTYTVLFFIFVMVLTILYFVNPFGLMTKYGGPVIFFTLFIGIVMVIMITIYQHVLSNSNLNSINDVPKFTELIIKAFYILGSISISIILIYFTLKMMGIFDQDSNHENYGNMIFNLVLFCAMLGIIYKLANVGGFLNKNPYYNLILNTLLYIPQILLGFIKGKFNASSSSNPYEIKILILSFVLLGGYFLWLFLDKHYIQLQGGKQLINQPISTNVLTNVATYQSLSKSDKFNYQYAISFWFYLDGFSPNTYNKIISLLSYGENPTVKYSSEDNTIYITVKQKETNLVTNLVETDINSETINKWKNEKEKEKISDSIEEVKLMSFGNETDNEGQRIIYKHSDVKLQKWNHMLLNYNGGTLDIFYNGKLLKSAIEVVPYMKFDMLTIGTENGISGNIANLIYFKQPLDYSTINTLYTSLKNKNPPVISTNTQTIVS